MKPYIAILIDSFWEAIGNRILWALLVGWGLVLCGLAPFGYVSEKRFTLVTSDISSLDQLKAKIGQANKGSGSASIRAIVKRLDPEFLKQIDENESNKQATRRPLRASDVAKELNKVLAATDLYDESIFPTAAKRDTIAPLLEKGTSNLSAIEREELNRRLMQIAFSTELNQPRGEKLWIGYAGFKLGEPISISRRQVQQFIEPLLLQLIIKLGLGIVAVFVALIVTSPMIPDTFKSGSLHLLLSKPISRVGLYLFKFFGGCVFVLFNITFLLVGLYFIAGFRFEIWNEGLLACIPLLLFVFIIFYSISALVGLIWGNAIICVVTCIVFWLFCFAIGAIHDGMSQHVRLFPQISRIDEINGKLLVINQRGDFNMWNEQYSAWQPALDNDAMGQGRTFGPIHDAARKQLLIKTFNRAPFGPPVARNRQLEIVRLNDAAEAGEDSKITSLTDARKKAYWSSDLGPEIPAQLIELLQVDQDVIAVCRGGLFRMNIENEANPQLTGPLAGMLKPIFAANSSMNAAPKDYAATENSTAALTAEGNGIVLFSSGTIQKFEYQDKKFVQQNTTHLDGDETVAGLIVGSNRFVVVARDSMPLTVLDGQLKTLHAEVGLPASENPRQLAWIPDSQDCAIITHIGNWYRLRCESGKVEPITSPYRGQITTMKWLGPNEVLLGIKPNRVVQYNIDNKQTAKTYAPVPTTLETVFNWLISPLYTVNPKPAALDNAMNYLLTGSKTQSMNLITNDLKQAQVEVDVQGPLISNTIFVCCVLLFSSIYLIRKEF